MLVGSHVCAQYVLPGSRRKSFCGSLVPVPPKRFEAIIPGTHLCLGAAFSK